MRTCLLLLGIGLTACGPKTAVEPLPVEIQEEPQETPAIEPSLLPDIVVPRAESRTLRSERDDTYFRLRRKLRSTHPRQLKKGLDELLWVDDTMFPDRLAVLEGQAHERLTNFQSARQSYLRALQEAHAPAVREQAARGMVSVLGHLGDYDMRLEYLDALIQSLEEPDWDLEIARAETLHALERAEEAQEGLREILAEHPNPRVVAGAETLLLKLSGKRKLTAEDERMKQLGRVRWQARTGQRKQALRTLAQLSRKQKKIDPEIAILEVDILLEGSQRTLAESKLLRLLKHQDATLKAAALLRLARIAALRFQYPRARTYFAQVMETLPDSPDALTAEFESAQIEYDSDKYEQAFLKMHEFVARHGRDKLSAKAAWLAGFSAHLSGNHATAIVTFERFLADEPDHPTALRTRYWLARNLELIGERERAGEIYNQLVQRTPFSYYGLLAEQRLHGMGVSAALHPLPPVPTPQTVEDVVSLMGPERPLSVDRANTLFEARLNREAIEELVGLAEHFRKSRNTQGATLVVDLFQIFGRDAWAFLLARHITQADDPDDLERRPYYWRVWRHAFPQPFEEEVRTASIQNGIDPFLVYAVMRTESLFRPEAVSPVGARGLMQLMPATARWIGRQDRRARPYARRYMRPDANIWLGAWYIRFLMEEYQGDVARALGAYNAGQGAMDRWGRRFRDFEPDEFVERIPYDETRAYVRRAMESYLVYQRIHPTPSVAQTEETGRSSQGS